MFRQVLLAALVTCSLGASLVAVQPASGDILSETPTPDRSNGSDRGSGEHESPDSSDRDRHDAGGGEHDGADEDDDRWYDRWRSGGDDRSNDRSDGEERSDDRSNGEERSSERSDGDDADRTGAGDGPDERRRGGGDDEGSPRASDDGTGDDDDGTGDGDDGTDGYDRTEERNGSTESDRWNLSASTTLPSTSTGLVLDGAGETVRSVTDGAPPAVDRDGVPGHVPLPDEGVGRPDLEEMTGSNDDAPGEQFVDPHVGGLLPGGTYEELRGGNGTVDGVLDGATVLLGFDGRDDGTVGDRPSSDTAPGVAQGDDVAPAENVAGESGPEASRSAAADAAAPAAGDGTSDRRDEDGESGGEDAGGGPAGAGAALVVTVGCLGGTRVAVTQASLLAPPDSESTLASLRAIAGVHLDRLPDWVVPPVFGYSRHDGSDPLENETRAEIHDLVRESPGIYHARLAEETGVTVETVRYHCRVLAEEGLVEPRKHRGRRRLFPVPMDDDPELAAAIADSAAADVLSAIERLEPATLSAVAERVGCTPSTVAYHLDRLEEDGLVSRERDGGAVRVRLRRSTRSALQGRVADD